MADTQLPSLGRNPFNTLRIVSGTERQGNDYVNADAQFMRGMLGKQQLDSSGNVEWIVAVNVKPDGVLNSHKTSAFYKSVSGKQVEIDGDGNGNTVPYLVTGSVLILSSTGSDITSDFTVNVTTGVITAVAHANETVYVNFKYNIQEPGMDETLGSGKVSVIRGVGELVTQVYDTSVTYAIGEPLYSQNGVISNDSSGITSPATKIAGYVVKPPTYDDPGLRFRINL